MTAKNAASKQAVDFARSLGCEVVLAPSGHYRATYRGRFVGTIPYSPSDYRAVKNSRSFIRRNVRRLTEGTR